MRDFSVEYHKFLEDIHEYNVYCQCVDCLKQTIRNQEDYIKTLEQTINSIQKTYETKNYNDILSDDEIEQLMQIRKIYLDETTNPISKERFNDLSHLYFITITFSPKRFYQHTEKQYKDYILYHLIRLRQLNLAFDYYGCFELHRSGVVHSHLIIRAYQIDEVRKYLNKQFNHDARNRKCIDIQPVTTNRVLDYINKADDKRKDRSNHFYILKDNRVVIGQKINNIK